MSKVLVVGDLHVPADFDWYLDWCLELQEWYQTDRTVFIGDIVDMHFATSHKKEVACPGSQDEFWAARAGTRRWHDAFPDADVIIGNHDRRHLKRGEEAGIPREVFRNFPDLWDTPSWTWHQELIIDDVLYVHGDECSSGVQPALKLALRIGRPVVCGHFHSKAGLAYSNPKGQMVWGMEVGCGANPAEGYFRYASKTVDRHIIGCGLVLDGVPALEVHRGV